VRPPLGSRDVRQTGALAAGTGGLVLLSFVVSACFFEPAMSLGLALGAGILVVAVARWSWSDARSAWRRASFVGGLATGAIAAGSRVQDEPGYGAPGYMQEIERAIGPFNDVLWALAATGGLAALVLAGLLFALTYWLLGPPPQRKA